mmetsp:Transcript_22817/g.54606  ORF Transcript_22817/g.54606 Transcript_22817/m.54606 type:complete len:242 (-) Transcript_22817:600-1325(-)
MFGLRGSEPPYRTTQRRGRRLSRRGTPPPPAGQCTPRGIDTSRRRRASWRCPCGGRGARPRRGGSCTREVCLEPPAGSRQHRRRRKTVRPEDREGGSRPRAQGRPPVEPCPCTGKPSPRPPGRSRGPPRSPAPHDGTPPKPASSARGGPSAKPSGSSRPRCPGKRRGPSRSPSIGCLSGVACGTPHAASRRSPSRQHTRVRRRNSSYGKNRPGQGLGASALSGGGQQMLVRGPCGVAWPAV